MPDAGLKIAALVRHLLIRTQIQGLSALLVSLKEIVNEVEGLFGLPLEMDLASD
jgi:hypothetical protein